MRICLTDDFKFFNQTVCIVLM